MALKITYVKCPTDKYAKKCPYTMKPTRIVVHNTYNNASAMNEISYMLKNNNACSFHYAVDHTRAVQGLPLNRNSWNAGDGRNGKGNRYAISIEICYSKSGGENFVKAEQNAAELVAMLLKQYGWGIDKVTKHQDYSNKYCPHRTLDLGWQRFLDMVQDKLDELNGVNKVESYSGYVQITYTGSDGIDIHSKPVFSGSVVKVAKKGEVFQVVGRIKVSGVYMYKLKDGNYITSVDKYVKYTKTDPTPKPAPKPTYKYQLGDTVKINGVYTGSNSTTKLTPDKKQGKITDIAKGTKNPYLLDDGNIGWVNEACITGKVTVKKDLNAVAKKVYNGKYGNGTDRVNKLKAEGYTDSEIKQIQALVNKMVK